MIYILYIDYIVYTLYIIYIMYIIYTSYILYILYILYVYTLYHNSWQITIVILFLPRGSIITQRSRRVKLLPWGELLVITPKKVSYISQIDLMKYLQMPVHVSNLEQFPLFPPKGNPRVFLVIWIILQLQRTRIENARIDKIDAIKLIDIIDCINQYKDNRYNRSDQLTLQTSPTQFHHRCFLFRFAWLIKVKSIVVLHSSVILLVRSPLLHLLLLFSTQSYSGTPSRGETTLPTRNGVLLCISWWAVSSWLSPNNRTLFLCSRSYQLQQGGSDNHGKCHSRGWSSKQWCSHFELGVW